MHQVKIYHGHPDDGYPVHHIIPESELVDYDVQKHFKKRGNNGGGRKKERKGGDAQHGKGTGAAVLQAD